MNIGAKHRRGISEIQEQRHVGQRKTLRSSPSCFWAMYGYVTCEGTLVVKLYETAYDTNPSRI